MSVLKCKMCGGTIEYVLGKTVGECQYCGTKQTLPKTDNEALYNLFNRANNMRLKCEFEKAISIYEKIVEQDDSEAEAHWGIVLCRYGIEYVEDPTTKKRIPTCHRTLYDPVTKDPDYQAAIDYSDTLQQAIYEKEAKEIDKIQKGILAIVQKEEPFDVFICYKETDEDGNRTKDSVIANDIYHQLMLEGYKVFYAAITLEDKLGQEYEPYIFAALNTAKVMLVIGSKAEFFNAVWVKNEWSRFLKLMKNDRSKILIPCYKDMDAYDLPEEFSHLQAQDMSKLGFMLDLNRVIKKIIDSNEQKTQVKEVPVTSIEANIEPLLKRAFMFLEDKNWEDANSYCERILDQDPENVQAYIGKLMVDFHVCRKEDLGKCMQPFDSNINYQKAIRFGDDNIARELNDYLAQANENNKLEERKTKRRIEAIASALKAGIGLKSESTAEEKLNKVKAKINSLTKILNTYNETALRIKSFREEINEVNNREKQLSGERDKLGIFDIKGKKQIDEEIRSLANKRTNLNDQITKLENQIGGYATREEAEHDFIIARRNAATLKTQIEKDGTYEVYTYSFKEAINEYISKPDVAQKINEIFPGAYFIPAMIGKKDGVFYGRYIQKENGKPEPIKWQVLCQKENKVLLVSKYALDVMPYNISYAAVTWQTCSLRKWLNEVFLNRAFNSSEQKLILKTNVVADDDNSGNDTKDKIFLLSVSELERYFGNKLTKKCELTEYAMSQGATTNYENTCIWWLRSPGANHCYTTVVSLWGSIQNNGELVDNDVYGVRPAIWVDIGMPGVESSFKG